MFERILLPVDFTDKNQRSLDLSVSLIKPGGVLYLLHVIEVMAGTSFEDFKGFYSSLEKQAKRKMKELSSQVSTSTFTIEPMIIYGNRIQEILRVAREQNVDLMIMSSHKLDLADLTQGWGTISYKVSLLADCPILLVK